MIPTIAFLSRRPHTCRPFLLSQAATVFARHRRAIARWALVGVLQRVTCAGAAQVAMTWNDNSTNELGFKVERAEDGGAFAQIATVGANTASYTDTSISTGVLYSYRVRAYNLTGDSAYSNVVSSDGTSIPPPGTNTAPTISAMADRTIASGDTTGALPFTVGDLETAADSLAVSGSSSNQALVPNGNLVFGGSGSSRTVALTPVVGQTGTATISVTVSDGALTATDTFLLTVSTANTAPTISGIAAQTINEDGSTGPLGFTVGDTETAATSLVVGGTSSNLTLVPNANIIFGGSGASRTLTVMPAANQSGTAAITVNASDGLATTSISFMLTVFPVNDAPTISAIANQTISANGTAGPLNFTVGDIETSAGSLTVSGSSSNTALLPNSNIIFTGSGASRTVTVTPAADQSGTAIITVTVGDGILNTSGNFVLTVQAAVVLPPPWQAIDIGLVGAAGGASWINGVFTIDGSGDDISGGADEFHYVFQSATGDCEIIARVATVENTHYRAKTGILIRESTTAGARYAAVLITPSDGVRFQRRTSTGGSTSNTRIGKVTAPEWLKLNRTGSTFRAYYSPDGTTWSLMGTQTITMGSTVSIGLGVCSRTAGTLCTSTIDNVVVTP